MSNLTNYAMIDGVTYRIKSRGERMFENLAAYIGILAILAIIGGLWINLMT